MWLKSIIACSATFTGGYVYLWYKNTSIKYCKKYEEKETGCEEYSSYMYLPENAEFHGSSTGSAIEGMIIYIVFLGNGLEYIDSSWVFLKKNSLPMYWKLLMLCKSKDHKVRVKAVESLSKISLEKWQYLMIAQACDVQTSIGLARNFGSSPNFFLSPPFRDLNEGNLQSELISMLSFLPSSNMDVCIQNLKKHVVKSANLLLRNGYSLDLDVGDPLVLYHSQQKKKEVFLFDKLCLQIILSYSAQRFHQNLMIEKGILKLLLKVMKSHSSDLEMHSLIAQILSNFAMEEKFINDIYMSGWIGILASWAKSSNIIVNLPAAKALANLDSDDIFHALYDDGIYILNPAFRQSQKHLSADVIFVHGLLGATFWTWRQCDTQKKAQETESINEYSVSFDLGNKPKNYSMCWPKDWLAIDYPSLRIISVDYKTCVSNWSARCFQDKEKDIISKRAGELKNKLLLSNVGERPIIWIAHSMGGLIVKKILTDAFESKEEKVNLLAQKTAGLVFYSVPHKGSELANKINSASRILQPSSDIAQLEKGSPGLLSLHEKFKNIVLKNRIPILSFGETGKTYWGVSASVLVPLDSSDPGVGEFYTLPVDHLSSCKPVSSNSSDYLKVLDFLRISLSKTITHDAYSPKSPEKVFEISKVLCLIP